MNFLKRDITNGLQGSKLWLNKRKLITTSNDIVYAMSHNGNYLKNKFSDKKSNFAMKRGTILENLSKQIFNHMYDVEIKDCGLIKHPNMNLGASPDGYFYITDRGNIIPNLVPYLIEIKNPYQRKIINLIPYKYWIQIQIQLFVCNLPFCYYMETDFKFKEFLTEEDKNTYQYYGKCTGDLKQYGKYWYLKNYFITKCERNDIWLQQKMTFIQNMCNKLTTSDNTTHKYNLRLTKNRINRKRKFNEMIEEENDNIEKKGDFYYNENSMHNYLNNDTLSDWLNMYSWKFPELKDKGKVNPFLKAVSNYNKICAGYLRQNLVDNYEMNYNIAQIPHESIISPYNIPRDLHNLTLYYMSMDYDIIYNAFLIDDEDKHYTNMFALVKGDVLCKETNLCDIDKTLYYPYIFKKKRLKVYDDKPNTLTNERSMRELKCSILFQCNILNKFQRKKIDKAFVLGYGYQKKNEKIELKLHNELFKNRVQCVILEDEKELSKSCKSAFKWLNLCHQEGMNWNPFNITSNPKIYRRYLLPNPCNDNRWSNVKKEEAYKYNDVGMFWKIGKELRRKLHEEGITKWTDPKFISFIENKFHKDSEMMKKMIWLSKDPNSPPLYLMNKKIKNNYNNWLSKNRLEFYVDFETINTSVSDMEIIYLIGMYIKYPDGTFEYIPYMLEELNLIYEADMIERWTNDMINLQKKLRCRYTPNIFCWGNAESQMMESALSRMKLMHRTIDYNINFIDMCKMFKTEPILIKGAHEGFGLKNILKHMTNNKLIDEIEYEDDFCNRGDISIIQAIKYYETAESNIKEGLIKYNEVDCIALAKIVNKVREYS